MDALEQSSGLSPNIWWKEERLKALAVVKEHAHIYAKANNLLVLDDSSGDSSSGGSGDDFMQDEDWLPFRVAVESLTRLLSSLPSYSLFYAIELFFCYRVGDSFL